MAATTFSAVYTRVMNRARIPTTDTTVLAMCKNFINDKYSHVAGLRKWWWLEKEGIVNVKGVYKTGTIGVTNASASFTGTGTAWVNATHANWIIKISGYEETYQVSAISSGTAGTFTQAYNGTTNSAASYIMYQPLYSLASDMSRDQETNIDFWPYSPDIVDLNRLSYLYGLYPEKEGKVGAYTLLGLDSSGYRRIKVWPVPDENYNLKYTYIRKITNLSADADTPLMPDEWVEALLVEGALSDLYDALSDPRSADQYLKYAKNLQSYLGRTEATEKTARLAPVDSYRRRRVPGRWRIDATDYISRHKGEGYYD